MPFIRASVHGHNCSANSYGDNRLDLIYHASRHDADVGLRIIDPSTQPGESSIGPFRVVSVTVNKCTLELYFSESQLDELADLIAKREPLPEGGE